MAEVSTNRQYLQGQWRVDAKAYDTLAAELKQFEEWASPQLAHYVEQQERIAQLVAALRDVKDATGITAKASLANQAWINRRCTTALKSPSLTREPPHCPSCSCGLASETPPRHGSCPFCGGMGGAHLITCEYSPAFKAETPAKPSRMCPECHAVGGSRWRDQLRDLSRRLLGRRVRALRVDRSQPEVSGLQWNREDR